MAGASNQGDALSHHLKAHIDGIELCLNNKLRMPALALIYCGIDIMGNLSRPQRPGETLEADAIRQKVLDRVNKLLRVAARARAGTRSGIGQAPILPARS